MYGSPEYDVQRRRVDDEHAEACTRDDACEVVVVADDGPSEREAELRFDSEDVEALDDEDREVDYNSELASMRLLLSSQSLGTYRWIGPARERRPVGKQKESAHGC